MYRNRVISYEANLKEAFKKMDDLDKKLLIVLKDDSFFGLISAGDIQRAIINDLSLDRLVKEILRTSIKVANTSHNFEDIKNMMLKYRMELCPVIDTHNKIEKVYYWEDLFQDTKPQPKAKFNLPVIIMAGGFGTRLRPLTNVLPKPLIPIGEKTMLEEIFDRFGTYGCNEFHISVNYKASLIKYYIGQQNLPYSVSYFEEDQPMGTAGSLSLLKNKIDKTFFVSNCDILIDQDYSEILEYHLKNKNEITIVAALKHYPIAYGTIETGEDGLLKALTEKPELTFKINSGMYILEPHLIDEIPTDDFFHITHLIEKLNSETRKVGVFPISENSWTDIGTWDEYMDVLGK